MRASVACERCRRSKTKCENDGLGTECKACTQHGRSCTYPPPAPSHARRDSTLPNQPALGAPNGDSEAPRKRQKRILAPSAHTTPSIKGRSTSEDPLNPELLTRAVWNDLYSQFQKHYSADLPFIHAPTFLCPQTPQPQASRLLLLAFLTLTAQYHQRLVKHHSRDPQKDQPRAASLYYYKAAIEELKNVSERPTLERVQTLLMLGLYEWGAVKGIMAWQHIGNAVRSAQQLGLHVNEGRKREMIDIVREPQQQNEPTTREDKFIQEEIKRRTFWSCFILDRYMSGGPDRPSNIQLEDVSIQLPCSDRAFQSAKPVRTACLTEDLVPEPLSPEPTAKPEMASPGYNMARGYRATPEKRLETDNAQPIPCETGNDEGALCHYIRAMELFKNTIKWSVNGGRRQERVPPWDPKCFVQKTDEKLKQLQSILGDYTLTTHHTNFYLASEKASWPPYVLTHILHLLCTVMLHREYIPWIALNCQKDGPTGPLDEPRFPAETWGRLDYWRDSAYRLFKAARDLTELLSTSEEWDLLVQTPLTFFCAFQAGVCGVYWMHYPWMDPDTQVSDQEKKEIANKCFAILRSRAPIVRQVHGWWGSLIKLDDHFNKTRKGWIKARKCLEVSSQKSSEGSVASDTRILPVKEGGDGGDLDEYRNQWEQDLKAFGKHNYQAEEDSDLDIPELEQDVKGPEENISDDGVVETPASMLPIRDTRLDVYEGHPQFTSVNGKPGISSPALPTPGHITNGSQSLKHPVYNQPGPPQQMVRHENFVYGQAYGPHPSQHYMEQSAIYQQESAIRQEPTNYPPTSDQQQWARDELYRINHAPSFGSDGRHFISGNPYNYYSNFPAEYQGEMPNSWSPNYANGAN